MTTALRTWFLRYAAVPLAMTLVGGVIAASFAAREASEQSYRLLVLNWNTIPLPIKIEVYSAMQDGRMRRWDFSAIERDLFDSPIAIVLSDPKREVTDPKGDLARLVAAMSKSAVATRVVFATNARNASALFRGADGCKYVGHVESATFARVERRSCPAEGGPAVAGDITSVVHLGGALPSSNGDDSYTPSEPVMLFPDTVSATIAQEAHHE